MVYPRIQVSWAGTLGWAALPSTTSKRVPQPESWRACPVRLSTVIVARSLPPGRMVWLDRCSVATTWAACVVGGVGDVGTAPVTQATGPLPAASVLVPNGPSRRSLYGRPDPLVRTSAKTPSRAGLSTRPATARLGVPATGSP